MRWYSPGQYLFGDESCFDFKGRYIECCYNPNKPAKWHFKAFRWNESVTSYLVSFYLYQEKDSHRLAIYKAIAIDKWYTGIRLAMFLY